MTDFPDAREAVALALMRDIEAAEEKSVGARSVAHPLHGLPLGGNR